MQNKINLVLLTLSALGIIYSIYDAQNQNRINLIYILISSLCLIIITIVLIAIRTNF